MGSYSFEQFLNIRSASGATMGGRSERMAFLTDITGTAQLWTLDGALRWPEQLTFYDDRLLFASYCPTQPQIAFGMDAGGNEEQAIFLIDDIGGTPRPLSTREAKHLWGGWSKDGTMVAWSHNARNGRDFDVFVYDLEREEERLVHQGEGYNYVAAWLEDSRGLIFGQADSNVNNNLWLLDLDNGERTHLTPHDGEAFYTSPVPAKDGQGCYLIANDERDQANLAYVSFESRQLHFIDDHPWEREEVALSADGRWLVLLTNEDGYSKLEVRELVAGQDPRQTRSMEPRRIETLPLGVFGGVRFCGSNDHFTVTATAPNESTDVWRVNAQTGDAQRWTRSSMAGILAKDLVEPELIRYESFDGLEIPAFYFRPATPGPHPVIIDIHGGPEGQRRPAFSSSTQYFVQEGFAVLSPNVRGSSGYGKAYMDLDNIRKRMDSVADIEAAHRWLIAHGGADPARIGLIGGSYGGFMVLSAMVTYPTLWAAGIDIVGIASFVTFLENTSEYRRHLRESEYGSLENDREFLHSISPLTHIDKVQAPLMVIHGRNDPRVPVSEAEQVVAAVRKNGLDVEALIYEDEGHGLAKRTNRLDAYPRIASFFERHLLDTKS